MPDPLLTLAEMCAKYHVSDRRARDIIRQHNVPVLQPGRKILFDEQAETAFREATRLNVDPLTTAPATAFASPSRLRRVQALSDEAIYAKALALTTPAEPDSSRAGRKGKPAGQQGKPVARGRKSLPR